MPTPEGYERIEVPVQKVDLHITVDDILNALEAHVSSLASMPQEGRTDAVNRLNRLIQFAQDLRGRLGSGEHTPPRG